MAQVFNESMSVSLAADINLSGRARPSDKTATLEPTIVRISVTDIMKYGPDDL